VLWFVAAVTSATMSFRRDELKRLTELAILRWPSQAERPHPYVLAPELALENLQADVRDSARAYFDGNDIAWWLSNPERAERKTLGIAEKRPTGHLNSSQIACVNHLEPARVDGELALMVARNLDARVRDVRDTGEDGYVAFEWIGERAYLSEPGASVRGANVTSLDALLRVILDDGTHALLVIEWKYLESYGGTYIGTSEKGTDRVSTYRALIEADDSPLVPGDPGRFFCQPYYQLMRQTLLAARAVADSDTPETEWIHVHVIPERNVALRERVKDAVPLLIGKTLQQTWRSALKAPDRYRVVTPADVVSGEVPARWEGWRRFLAERYLT
jgi:hypothetical protein